MAKGISKKLALQVASEIEAVCQKHGIWVDKTEQKQPDLKAIKLAVSIKVEGK